MTNQLYRIHLQMSKSHAEEGDVTVYILIIWYHNSLPHQSGTRVYSISNADRMRH